MIVPGVGKLKGTTLLSEDSRRPIYGFWGIPYGAPPLGIRRFAPPVPAPPLNDGSSSHTGSRSKEVGGFISIVSWLQVLKLGH